MLSVVIETSELDEAVVDETFTLTVDWSDDAVSFSLVGASVLSSSSSSSNGGYVGSVMETRRPPPLSPESPPPPAAPPPP